MSIFHCINLKQVSFQYYLKIYIEITNLLEIRILDIIYLYL